VNRDFERLILLSIVSAVRAANAPWECNSIGRPCWDPRIVAVCVFMKISLCKTYDGIEAYLKSNTFVAQRLGVEQLLGHSVIARGMAKMPTSYIRLISRLMITDWKGSDAKEFKRLIRDLPQIRKAAGDKAYSSRVNCQAVADKGKKSLFQGKRYG